LGDAVTERERLRSLRALDILDTPAEEGFDIFPRLAAAAFAAPIAAVTLVDADRLWFKAAHGLEVPEVPRCHGFCGVAVGSPDRVTVVPDTAADPRFRDSPLVRVEPALRFYAGVPVRAPDGHAVGTLCVMDRVPRAADPGALAQLEDLARGVGTALHLHDAVRALRRMATTDGLTGLANRAAFDAELARRGPGTGLVLLDLDRFKRINDAHGHAGGDAALREMARRLRARLRAGDLAARLGGDEFAVLCGGPDGAAAAAGLAERLDAELRAPFLFDGRAVPISASLGCAALGEDADAALRAADHDMYRRKRLHHAGASVGA